jgi:hypothetical protein
MPRGRSPHLGRVRDSGAAGSLYIYQADQIRPSGTLLRDSFISFMTSGFYSHRTIFSIYKIILQMAANSPNVT